VTSDEKTYGSIAAADRSDLSNVARHSNDQGILHAATCLMHHLMYTARNLYDFSRRTAARKATRTG